MFFAKITWFRRLLEEHTGVEIRSKINYISQPGSHDSYHIELNNIFIQDLMPIIGEKWMIVLMIWFIELLENGEPLSWGQGIISQLETSQKILEARIIDVDHF